MIYSLALGLLVVAVAGAIVLVIRFEIFCLTDIARANEVRHLSKPAWAAVCIFSIPFGCMLYLLYGRVDGPGGGGRFA